MIASVSRWSIAILLAILWVAASGCSASPVAPARPTVVKENLERNLLSNNRMLVCVRNDGEAGPVKVVVSAYAVTTHSERGESGVGKFMRESFTTSDEPPRQSVNQYRDTGRWEVTRDFAKGETQEFAIELPGYSSWSIDRVNVYAFGLLPPKDASPATKAQQ